MRAADHVHGELANPPVRTGVYERTDPSLPSNTPDLRVPLYHLAILTAAPITPVKSGQNDIIESQQFSSTYKLVHRDGSGYQPEVHYVKEKVMGQSVVSNKRLRWHLATM